MEFITFKVLVKNEVERRTGGKCNVCLNDIIKNNGVKLCGLTVAQNDCNTATTIYLNDYYEAYESGKATLEDVINDMMSSCEATINIDMRHFLDYNSVKDRIVYKLINTEKNRELLEGIPHFEYLDLSIVFQYLLEDVIRGSRATVLIHNTHLKMWGITPEEIYSDAKRNTPILDKYEIKSIDDVLSEIMPLQNTAHDKIPLYVLSNKSMIQGAACMLYPDLLKNFSGEIDSNIYIIPSSIHEVLLLPTDENDKAESIKQLIKVVNDTQVEEEEVLSYSVYFYDCGNEKIEIVA